MAGRRGPPSKSQSQAGSSDIFDGRSTVAGSKPDGEPDRKRRRLSDKATEQNDRYALFASTVLNAFTTSNHSTLGADQYVRPPIPTSTFYESVYTPEKTLDVSRIDASGLDCELYPFQKRAVRWLLQREGVQFDLRGVLQPYMQADDALPISFSKLTDSSGVDWYYSELLKQVTKDQSKLMMDDVRGGILAEEMGLGKTVELIALFNSHRRQIEQGQKMFDTYSNSEVHCSCATLIITPKAILEQWKDELNSHAPALSVFHYTGLKGSGMTCDEMTQHLLSYDVVVTTYNVLGSEIHYAREKSTRSLRHAKKYEAPRSPLVQISWWRVCLDEAQMIENGVSNAATVARMVPRCNAWAVTGTPLKKDVSDLRGLLIFLRYETFCQTKIWNKMITGYVDTFKALWGRLAMRHTKSQVRDELQIPPQNRIVLKIDFTAIEEQHYGDLYHEMCDSCGLDSTGAPLSDDWDPEDPRIIEVMRTYLTRLRQSCLHPEVGGRNRRALGLGTGVLRTVDEVLEVMIEQNETVLRAEERALIMETVMRGHIISFGGDARRALQVYSAALQLATTGVSECRAQLTMKEAEIKNPDEIKKKSSIEDDSEAEDEDSEKKGKLIAVRQRLRNALGSQHVCLFYCATAYFQIKEDPQSSAAYSVEGEGESLEEMETRLYGDAKTIRTELLSEITRKVNRRMDKVKNVQNQALTKIPVVGEYDYYSRLESRRFMSDVTQLTRMLNEQARQIEEYRQKLIGLLLIRLVDQSDDTEMTGEEYETSTKQQDEQYVYLFALKTLLSDRHMFISGQTNELVDYETREAFKLASDGKRSDPNDKGHAPELMISVLSARLENSPMTGNNISLRGVVAGLRATISSVNYLSREGVGQTASEAIILDKLLEHLQSVVTTQTKTLASLNKEFALFRDAMNDRLEYYKQLQQISDTVAPLEEVPTDIVDEPRVSRQLRLETYHGDKFILLQRKRRYLVHLRNEATANSMPSICVICQSDFEIGAMTSCGHIFCKECISEWLRSHHRCPTCKKYLKRDVDLQDITYKPKEIEAKQEIFGQSAGTWDSQSPLASKTSIYSGIQEGMLNAIKRKDLKGSYGSKIDTLARHLLWLRDNDHGCKSIIFSQYRDFLDVLTQALAQLGVQAVSIADKNGIARFKEDATIECFLLHAKADSSGLNLINATHVFLCEPLINPAIELQAIARVHRIGQRKSTTVWMYLVSNTVEETIYEISVSRRLALLHGTSEDPNAGVASMPAAAEDAETALDAVNSLELQKAPMKELLTAGHSGGEMVAQNDLWGCLFQRPRRDPGMAATAAAAASTDMSTALGRAVGTHLRGEAAENRRDVEMSG